MRESYEFLEIQLYREDFEEDEGEMAAELAVDPNDPLLTEEPIDVDLDASAFATALRVRVSLDGPESIAERPHLWQIP